MVDFLYGMNWRRFVEEKRVKMSKFSIFWAKTYKWYRYQRVVPVPMIQWASGTGTTQIGTGTTTFSSPVFAYFAPLSPVFLHRLFRNPKKRLMEVQIRMRLSEKRTVPRRLSDIHLV